MDAQSFLMFLPVFVIAITCHEAAHAWTALHFGDPTARDLGRLTLNPLKHLDVLGTIFFLVAGFGWAKPVPVNPANLKDPVRDDVWISAAGPAANLVLAVASAIAFRLWILTGGINGGSFDEYILRGAYMSITINLALAVFNMIPVMPLDGSHVMRGLLPRRYIPGFDRLNAIGPMVLLGVILIGRFTQTPILGSIIWPPVRFLRSLLLAGVS